MADPGITSRVLDSLVQAGLLTVEQLATVDEAARERGVDAGELLAERGLVSASDVASVLEHDMGVPSVDLASYAPEDEALSLVPAAVARSRGILPLFEIEGMLTVVIGDPMDVFKLDGTAAMLGLEVEPVLADTASVRAAIAHYYPAEQAEAAAGPAAGPVPTAAPQPPAPPVAEALEAPAAPSIEVSAPLAAESIESLAEAGTAGGARAIDLDVLAVADARAVTMLVADILEDAVGKDATRIHLLPYKDEFFLVYRVQDRLEKVASAPRSLQAALVDGFKAFGKLAGVPASTPALGRVRARIAERECVLTVSAVPTISGQRLVIGIAPLRSDPPTLPALGVSTAEGRALMAMTERGRGLLLVAAPVAEGRSATYYALIAHAAAAGRTVYSVERAIEYEIPAVAQVMVNPGSPIPTANFIAAGLRQDTDVIAVDGLRTVEDVHLAIEAAGLGKLVIVTFPAADIAAAVRRMLDLGAEPYGLAAALTLGVGQRLVRRNCPDCSQEVADPLVAALPGAPAGLKTKAGSGCPNCGKTGMHGATGIFEVLPFTEPVRARVAAGVSVDEIRAAAIGAGMRPLVASGLARVASGEVSVQELDRVLRFSD